MRVATLSRRTVRLCFALVLYLCSGKGSSGQGVPVVSAVLSAATFESSAVSPGEYIAVFGANMSAGAAVLTSVSNGALPTDVGGTRLMFNGIAAPLLYVSTGQINAIVPYGVTGNTANVVVARQQQISVPLQANILSSHPGLFTLSQTGSGPIAASNQTGILNSSTNAAPSGSVIVMYGTGMGALSPSCQDGRIATSSPLQLSLIHI